MNRYFDANATTPLCPEARAAWLEAADEFWQNPSSPTRASARVHARLEQAREQLAAHFGAPAESVVFNSGATEGNRDVFAYWNRVEPGGAVAVSAVEHPSVLENARVISGGRLVKLPVDADGRLDLVALEQRLTDGGLSLVSLMAANNETGVLQPWRECLALCRKHRAAMHIDATQWIGKMPLGGLAQADFITGSGHKFGGPKGVGFLLVAGEHSGFQGQRGGEQENAHRAGTENYPSIAGMIAALDARIAHLSADGGALRLGRDQFEARLTDAIGGVRFWGRLVDRLPNTSSLCLREQENTRWVRRLDQRGFAVSTGSACSTGKEGPSHVLAAMGASSAEARRTIRLSALPEAKAGDWTALGDALIELWQDRHGDQGNAQVIQI